MTPTERIELIKKIADTLSKEEWSIIDLTLHQFDIGTYVPNEDVSPKKYIIDCIQNIEDKTLAQLNFHLLNQEKNNYPAESLEFWQPGQFRIFLSHVSKQKESAVLLSKSLSAYHISTFIAHKDIKPTKEWMEEIRLALFSCDCIITMMTNDFHDSDWTDQEIGIGMGLNKLIIPINLGSKIYGFLSKYQWLKPKNKSIDNLSQDIFNLLKSHNLSKKKLSEAIINKFQSSYSFMNARENAELLDKLDYLDSDLIRKIQDALTTNDQINQSFGVPNKIRRIIERVEKT